MRLCCVGRLVGWLVRVFACLILFYTVSHSRLWRRGGRERELGVGGGVSVCVEVRKSG